MERRSNELDLSMSDYLRTLIKQDLKLNDIDFLESIKEKQVFDIDNINKKLSGYHKGLR